jgi:uncharacterized protein YdiU (UPF0061 family)
MSSIAELSYDDRFVRELPADPRTDNTLRQVNACYSRVTPTAVAKPEMLLLVPEVAALLNLSPEVTPELTEVLGGNRVVGGMKPYAACYGGHQFGNWAGQLGDGRAITLGEVVGQEGEFGNTWEIQLKGAGPTPYSRRADGRAVLRSSVREVVCSEAMFHLGVPTTRALSLVATGDPVERDLLYDGHPKLEPGAVACRVSPSFLRFGNFEIHTARDNDKALRTLVEFTLERFYPRYRAGFDVVGMFDEVMRRTAWMVCEWMRVGFVHGVMNTDNMSILGLTIDYGPYGWIEPFDLDWTPNITDASGKRYRFGHQPRVAHWNLAQLARALVPVADPAQLERVVSKFPGELDIQFKQMMLRKLGLHAHRAHAAIDDELLGSLGHVLTSHDTDMTLFYRALAELPREPRGDDHAILEHVYYGEPDPMVRLSTADWLARYRARIAAENLGDDERRTRMNSINPLYVPRNYLLQQVIDATEAGDRKALPEIVDVLRTPYVEQPGREKFAAKRPEWARVKPGCSMLSCSS